MKTSAMPARRRGVRMLRHRIEREILPYVTKPSRYLGNEINSIRKPLESVGATVAFAFPDKYEVGMSHLGLQLLYKILNDRPDVAAERVFAPDLDCETLLRSKEIPLCTLESGWPLGDVDILAFTLQYELCYTNVLAMLDLGGIPLKSDERGEEDPFVIAGGSCTANTEPLADFIDLFVIGDGEEVTHEIIDAYQKAKRNDLSRQATLRSLAELTGVYVPTLFDVTYQADGSIAAIDASGAPHPTIERRVIWDLNEAAWPTKPIVPFMHVVHERVAIEVARGCTRGCRFCQAGYIMRPTRERTPETIERIVRESLRATGYEEVSLMSLSTGDYSELDDLVVKLMERFTHENVSISLPSLRPGSLNPELVQQIGQVRKSGFTLAPEAGSERLRKVINKTISEDDLLRNVQEIVSAGWDSLKLYFMIGLPTETNDDLDGIVRLCTRALEIRGSHGRRLKNINLGISSFVPKPHTPFQWLPQERLATIRAKQNYLFQRLKKKTVHFRFHDAESSYLEAVFSRGDRRLGRALLAAYELGARFDGWAEHFDLATWRQAFAKADLDPDFYAYRSISDDEVLPWDHIDSHTLKKFHLRDLKRSLRIEPLEDCRYDVCTACGPLLGMAKKAGLSYCTTSKRDTAWFAYHNEHGGPHLMNPHLMNKDGPAENGRVELPLAQAAMKPTAETRTAGNPEPVAAIADRPRGSEAEVQPITDAESPEAQHVGSDDVAAAPGSRQAPVRQTVRLRYSKQRLMKYLSQLELQAVLRRALRRRRIPLAYSRGFNPHPKLSFGLALPVGVESREEYCDVSLTRWMAPDLLQSGLNLELPDGLTIEGAEEITLLPGLTLQPASIRYEVVAKGKAVDHLPGYDAVVEMARCFMARESIPLLKGEGRRGKRPKVVDARPLLDSFNVVERTAEYVRLRMRLLVRDDGTIKPNLIVREFLQSAADREVELDVRKLEQAWS